MIVLASAASTSIHITCRSASSQRTTPIVEVGADPSPTPTGPGCGGGRRSKTRLAENRNSIPAMIVTGSTPYARTISGASTAFPSRSAAEEIRPSIEFAAASSSAVATSGSVDASDGCENWCRRRTTKITTSSDRKSEPNTKATASVSTPIPT